MQSINDMAQQSRPQQQNRNFLTLAPLETSISSPDTAGLDASEDSAVL
jgi:hypothetical protein